MLPLSVPWTKVPKIPPPPVQDPVSSTRLPLQVRAIGIVTSGPTQFIDSVAVPVTLLMVPVQS